MDRREIGRRSRRQGRAAELKLQQIFESWGWIAREDNPDDGYDLNVEIPGEGANPVRRILVQLKSSGEMIVRDKDWRVPLPRQRLSDYRAHRFPVFVFALEVSSNSFRWCAADSVALVQSPKSRKRGGRNSNDTTQRVYLLLPESQTLSDEYDEGFADAIREAWDRRDDKFHAPVKAAAVRARLLEQKDDRFSVNVNVVKGSEICVIEARDKPVPLTAHLSLAKKENAEALLETYRFGTPSTVSAAKFSITGSRLFEDLPKTGLFSVGSIPRRVRMLLGFREKNSSRYSWLIEEDGDLFSGAEGADWKMNAPNFPLRIRARYDTTVKALIFSYTLERETWAGNEFRALPFLKPFIELIDGALESGVLSLAMRHEGEVKHLADMPIYSNREQLDWISQWLHHIAAIRTVCIWAKRDMPWIDPIPISGEEQQQWEQAAELVRGEKVSISIRRMTFDDRHSQALLLLEQHSPIVVRNVIDLSIREAPAISVPFLAVWSNYEVTHDVEAHEIIFKSGKQSTVVMQLDEKPIEPPPLSLLQSK